MAKGIRNFILDNKALIASNLFAYGAATFLVGEDINPIMFSVAARLFSGTVEAITNSIQSIKRGRVMSVSFGGELLKSQPESNGQIFARDMLINLFWAATLGTVTWAASMALMQYSWMTNWTNHLSPSLSNPLHWSKGEIEDHGICFATTVAAGLFGTAVKKGAEAAITETAQHSLRANVPSSS